MGHDTARGQAIADEIDQKDRATDDDAGKQRECRDFGLGAGGLGRPSLGGEQDAVVSALVVEAVDAEL
jgi:hypothetical protein